MTSSGPIQENTSPSQTVTNFFEHFNNADEDALNCIFDSPCVFIIDNKTNVFDKYSDAVDFDNLRKNGWSYSKINTLEPVYEDNETAMVQFNFSRFDDRDHEISVIDAAHLMVRRGETWRIKVVFVFGELALK